MAKRNRKAGRKIDTGETFDGPEKAGEGQILVTERFNEGSVGMKKRVRNLGAHPLFTLHARGKITDEMYDAGRHYSDTYETTYRSGRDSTQSLDLSRSGESKVPWSDVQARASAEIARIDGALPPRSRIIIRAFCGDGHSAAEAVRKGFPIIGADSVQDRLREALLDLKEAIDTPKARKVA